MKYKTPIRVAVCAIVALITLAGAMAVLTDSVAYWPMDETSEASYANLTDITGGGSNATHVTNPIGNPTNYVKGIIGNARFFYEDNKTYFNVTNISKLNNISTNNFTINYWFKLNNTIETSILLNAWQSSIYSQGWYTAISSSNLRFQLDDGNNPQFLLDCNNIPTYTSYVTGNWNMFTFKRNGTNISMYVNAQQCNSTIASAVYNVSINNQSILGKYQTVKIGNTGAGNIPNINASIDEVGFWSRDLSQSEISQLYNLGNGCNPYSGCFVAAGINFTATDNLDNTTILEFNATFFNESYSYTGTTLNGILIPYINNQTWNVTISAPGYTSNTTLNYNMSANLSVRLNWSYGNATLNVSHDQDGFIATITQNDTGVTRTKNTTGRYVLFNVIQGLNYSVFFNATNTSEPYQSAIVNVTNVITNYTFRSMSANRLNIFALNFTDGSFIAGASHNVTITLVSPGQAYSTWTTNGSALLQNISVEEYIVCGSASSWTRACYEVSVTNRSTQDLTMRLVSNASFGTFLYYFYIKSTTNLPIANVTVTFQQQNGANWYTINQITTDNNGYGQVQLQDGTYYRLIFDAPGYTTRQVTKFIYTALAGEIYYLTPTGYSPFIPTSVYVEYYIYPNTTRLFSGENNFSITTYSANGSLAWTAVYADGSLTNLTSSSTGGTANILINVTDANTPLAVTYAYRVTGYDVTSWTYYYTILANNESESGGIQDVINQGSTTIPSQSRTVWMAIISMLLVAVVCITMLELTDNRAASAFCGLGTLGMMAAFGWLNIPVTALCGVIIIGYMVMQ